jgi:hypothetical protein
VSIREALTILGWKLYDFKAGAYEVETPEGHKTYTAEQLIALATEKKGR